MKLMGHRAINSSASWLAMVLIGALLVSPGWAVASSTTASGNGDSVSADFNGDGYGDLAVGVQEGVDGAADAGAVNVIYGSTRGLSADGDQFWTQNSPGIADVAEEEDFFSWWLSSADFNGDGFGDLAAGAGGEDVGDVADAGAVHVIYGSRGGLSAAGDEFLTQDSPGIADVAENADCFGCTTGGGDFNGDGFADLLVGVQAEDVAGAEDAGAVHVIYGGEDGLSPAGSQLWSQDSPGVSDVAEEGDNFGWAFATREFGKDDHVDLAVAAPFEDVGAPPDAGAVHVLFGSADGLSAGDDQLWTQDSPGIQDSAEEGDWFGYSLVAADFQQSTHAELAIAAPGEDVGGAEDVGIVNVINGSAGGLTAAGDQVWWQGSAAETGDFFGDSLAAANFGRGHHVDLAVGADGEDVGEINGAGAVDVFYGSRRGLSADGHQFWTQDTAGVAGHVELVDDELGEGFGYLLLAVNFGRSDQADLAATVPGESIGQVQGAGGVNVLYGSRDGLTAQGDQFWSQDSPGIKDTAEKFDFLGTFTGAPT